MILPFKKEIIQCQARKKYVKRAENHSGQQKDFIIIVRTGAGLYPILTRPIRLVVGIISAASRLDTDNFPEIVTIEQPIGSRGKHFVELSLRESLCFTVATIGVVATPIISSLVLFMIIMKIENKKAATLAAKILETPGLQSKKL